jgi:hypothetical protein
MSYDTNYLVCILHTCFFYKSYFINIFSTTFSQNARVHAQQETVRVVNMHVFLVHKIDMQCMKNNIEHYVS